MNRRLFIDIHPHSSKISVLFSFDIDDIFAGQYNDSQWRDKPFNKEEWAAKKQAERKEVYELADTTAVEIVGGEQYILSATMHADERNRAMSEALGEDVYHYHLHVVYIPVVENRFFGVNAVRTNR